jgi:hypothetical protein
MPSERSPHCNSCASEKQETFSAEIAIHFVGLEGLDKPIVWVFPHVRICLECGISEFSITKRELGVLATGLPAEGAVISISQKRDKAS